MKQTVPDEGATGREADGEVEKMLCAVEERASCVELGGEDGGTDGFGDERKRWVIAPRNSCQAIQCDIVWEGWNQ